MSIFDQNVKKLKVNKRNEENIIGRKIGITKTRQSVKGRNN